MISVNRSRAIHVIRPLEDSRWQEFVECHPHSSVFHTAGWLEALHRTYGYVPVALTTSAAGEQLQSAWVFCSINSFLTGRRWVSLPFSDHCQPLIHDSEEQGEFESAIDSILRRERLRYIELRPLQAEGAETSSAPAGVSHSSHTYCFHFLDLTPDLCCLLRNCHKDSTQRKIRRAEREGLGYEEGRDAKLLDAFYDLQMLTRRRHGLPPQPKEWFRNVIQCLGMGTTIRVAYRGKYPVASIMTMRHKDTTVYKYGCSDAAHSNLGGMHLLFWKTIEEGKRDGIRILDLGRSDHENNGLITFKDRWGSTRSLLSYSRFTSAQSPKDVYLPAANIIGRRLAPKLFSSLPTPVTRAVGELLYRHLG